MKTDAILKINKMGQIGSIILIIAKVLCILGLVGTLIGTVVIGVMPKELITFGIAGKGDVEVDLSAIGVNLSDEERAEIGKSLASGEVSGSLDVNGTTITFDDFSVNGNVIHLSSSGESVRRTSLHSVFPAMICALVSLALTLTTLFFAGFLAKAFKTCQSPFEENVIKKMRNFAYSLIPWVVMKSVSESIFESIFSGRLDVNISIDFAMLAIVLVILALVYIFQYGAVLQQESDETL